MEEQLYNFLTTGTYLCSESVTWGNGTIPLQSKYYLSNKQPPLKYVSSVRAIVFRENSVLVITSRQGQLYILPGGRVETGELPLETLKREVLEETGWSLRTTVLLGFMHFKHLGPKPDNYEYPYPDFIWPIYIGEANSYTPEAILPDDWVKQSHFQLIREVQNLPIREGEILLLDAASKLREK